MAINTFNYHEFANAFTFATICGEDHRMIDNVSIIPTDTLLDIKLRFQKQIEESEEKVQYELMRLFNRAYNIVCGKIYDVIKIPFIIDDWVKIVENGLSKEQADLIHLGYVPIGNIHVCEDIDPDIIKSFYEPMKKTAHIKFIYNNNQLHIGIHYDTDPNDIILVLYTTKQLDERFN